MNSHSIADDLIDELDSFDPKWKKNYKALHSAVEAAGPHAVKLYREYLATQEGQQLAELKQTSVDWIEVVERNKRHREAEINMAATRKSAWVGQNGGND